jgi:uncharacterized protein with von Willebrand factor type A (vWA) domain
MFIDFFYHLRDRGLSIGTHEFLSLLEALSKGLARESLTHFYVVARSLLVKRPEDFDTYDQAFAEYFRDVEFDAATKQKVTDELLEWLENDPLPPPDLSEEEIEAMESYDFDELREEFEERLGEQEERHDGGSHWIGTGGSSPFGHSGDAPRGVRVGGESRNRSAVQVASERRFKNLRDDVTLGVRDISQALRRLRRLTREGRDEELDVDATIEATSKNAGELDLVFRPSRGNDIKLLLLMDIGGSMNPFTRLTTQLFSAAHQVNHFKAFESYYFHNCPYETLYTDMARQQGEPTERILGNLDQSWCCFVVGDAAMAPEELMREGGSVDYFHQNERPGIEYLREFKESVPNTVWLNPRGPMFWGTTWTTQKIRELFPMFELTMEGLEEAVDELRAAVQ